MVRNLFLNHFHFQISKFYFPRIAVLNRSNDVAIFHLENGDQCENTVKHWARVCDEQLLLVHVQGCHEELRGWHGTPAIQKKMLE